MGNSEALARSGFLGTNVPEVVERLGNQLCSCLWFPDDLTPEEAAKEVLTALMFTARFSPRNELEAMLAVQPVATHNAAMECMKRAMIRDQSPSGCDLYLKHAEKLFRIFKEQAESISHNQRDAPQLPASDSESQPCAEQAQPVAEGEDDAMKVEQSGTLCDLRAFLDSRKAS